MLQTDLGAEINSRFIMKSEGTLFDSSLDKMFITANSKESNRLPYESILKALGRSSSISVLQEAVLKGAGYSLEGDSYQS